MLHIRKKNIFYININKYSKINYFSPLFYFLNMKRKNERGRIMLGAKERVRGVYNESFPKHETTFRFRLSSIYYIFTK